MRLCIILLFAAFSITSPSQTSTGGVVSSPAQNGLQSAKPTSPSDPLAAGKRESWTELSLDKSGLPRSTFNAVLLGKFDEPTYVRELVRVEWRPDDPIELTILLPKGVSNPPVILYLYDYTADGSRFQSDGWCRRATQGGFAAVGFVSALSGQRFHSPRPMREWFVSEMQESLATSTHDVQMILNYLAARSDLDISKVGMIAQGSGGAVAVLAASVDSRISALDLINPWGDWPDWLKGSAQIPPEERAKYLTPAFLGGVATLDPVAYLPNLKVNAIRIQQIMDDPVTPAPARDRIAASLPSPADQVVRYPNAVAHQSAWRSDGLSGWMRERLKSPMPNQVQSDVTNSH